MANKTNCKINGNEYYRITKVVGYKYDKNGKKKPIQKQFYGANKKQAQDKFDAWRVRKSKSESIKSPESTFGALASFYTDEVMMKNAKYAESTKVLYESAYKRFIEPNIELMSHAICDLKGIDIQMFFNGLGETRSNLNAIRKYMAGLFKWMQINDYCPDLMIGVVMPYPEQPLQSNGNEIEIWDDHSISLLMEFSEGHRLRLMPVLALGCGLRAGEIRGLKYSDFYDGMVHVNRQSQKSGLIPPKYNSYRDVPLHRAVAEELAKHKLWHEKEMELNGYETDFVFTSSTGKLLDASAARRSLERLYASISETHPEFEPHKLHALRATFCTNLRKAGVRVEIASKLMGHKSVNVTLEYYSSVNESDMISAIDMMRLPEC